MTPAFVRWATGLLACAGLLATVTPARAQSSADALSGAAALAAPTDANKATLPAAAIPPRVLPRPVKADPFEGFNRGVFAFNEAVDHALLKPLAMAYKAAVPSPLRTGVDNVFGNVGDAWSAINLLLQGKGKPALEMTVRVTTNTVFGIGGLFDLASDAGLERQSEDFGQTLGKWGLGAGPYLVLPFYGASSLRDAVGLPLDRKASLPGVVHDGAYRWGLTTLELVHGRADLLSATNLLDQVALDKYSFVRDSYLARRRNQVFDGNPPEEPPDEEPLPPLAAPPGPDAPVATPAAPQPSQPAQPSQPSTR
ncbi:MAG: VacJ family lipoprotein [Betaproteobacteria bacterium]|jgi:phospholipid-binding lipoprotein MlaA